MTPTPTPGNRFRELRQLAGLSHARLAERTGFPSAGIWDLEEVDGVLSSVYSPIEIRQLAHAVGVHPTAIFGAVATDPAVSAEELVRLIHLHCHSRGITLQQLEEGVGWTLEDSIDPPERLLEAISIDGLQWLCQALGIDWHRVICGL